MFKLFMKDSDLYAPISGKCLDIAYCQDAAFASKALGDGFMIIPDEEVVKSPCDGKLTAVFPTKHAVGITMADGKEILLHIGIDTVKFDGKYFEAFVTKGDRVKKGDPLIRFNQKLLEKFGADMSTIVILLNGDGCKYEKYHMNDRILSGEKIIKFESGD